MADHSSAVQNLNTKNGNFICGVVEGKLRAIHEFHLKQLIFTFIC